MLSDVTMMCCQLIYNLSLIKVNPFQSFSILFNLVTSVQSNHEKQMNDAGSALWINQAHDPLIDIIFWKYSTIPALSKHHVQVQTSLFVWKCLIFETVRQVRDFGGVLNCGFLFDTCEIVISLGILEMCCLKGRAWGWYA